MRVLAEGDRFYLPLDTEIFKVVRVDYSATGEPLYTLRGMHDGGNFKATHYALEDMNIERIQ